LHLILMPGFDDGSDEDVIILSDDELDDFKRRNDFKPPPGKKGRTTALSSTTNTKTHDVPLQGVRGGEGGRGRGGGEGGDSSRAPLSSHSFGRLKFGSSANVGASTREFSGSEKIVRKNSDASTVFDSKSLNPISGIARSSKSWLDLYAPNTSDQSVLHKKKVDDIRTWLIDASKAAKDRVKHSSHRFPIPSIVTNNASDTIDLIDDAELDAILNAVEARVATGAPLDLDSGSTSSASLASKNSSIVSSQQQQQQQQQHLQQQQQQQQQQHPLPLHQPRLLIVCGPPGIGKSTTVRLLCKELRLSLKEWTDPAARGSGGGVGSLRGFSRNRPGDDDDGGAAGENDLDDVIRKMEATSTFDNRGYSDFYGGGALQSAPGGVRDFCVFLGQTRLYKSLNLVISNGHASSTSTGKRSFTPLFSSTSSSSSSLQQKDQVGEILFIEDIPRPHNFSDEKSWRSHISDAFLSLLNSDSTRSPAVLIVSEGEQPGDAPTKPALAKLLGQRVLDHPSTLVIEVPRTPETRMRKALSSIAMTEPKADSSIIEDIIMSASGDLRHAIMSLEFGSSIFLRSRATSSTLSAKSGRLKKQTGTTKGKTDTRVTTSTSDVSKKRPRNIDEDSGDVFSELNGLPPKASACGRDDFFDSLHSLGKLMYAKRNELGELEFDPDSISAGCAYDSATTAAFLLENCVSRHSSINDLALTLDALSCGDILLGSGGGSRISARESRSSMAPGSAFPEQYAGAIITRANSTYNLHQTPFAFTAIRRPTFFSVDRIRTANMSWITEQCLGLCADVGIASVNASLETHALVHENGEKDEYSIQVSLSQARDRAIYDIPCLGVILSQLKKKVIPPQSQGAKTNGSTTRTFLSSMSHRSQALILAACSFEAHSSSFGGSQSRISDVTDNDSSIHIDLDVSASLVRKVDEDKEEEDTILSSNADVQSHLSLHPQFPTVVSTAGLVQGMWEYTVARLGVDARRNTHSSAGIINEFSSKSGLTINDDDIQDFD
jgi:DNA polymerase III delta prime subunit